MTGMLELLVWGGLACVALFVFWFAILLGGASGSGCSFPPCEVSDAWGGLTGPRECDKHKLQRQAATPTECYTRRPYGPTEH